MTAIRLPDGEVGVPEAFVRVLEQAGVEFVFGMPGGPTGGCSTPCTITATIRTVLVREEGWRPSWRTCTVD